MKNISELVFRLYTEIWQAANLNLYEELMVLDHSTIIVCDYKLRRYVLYTFLPQMSLCYAGVFHVTTLDAVLPQHHPSLFCSSPLLNNTLLLLLFVGSHRYVELFPNVYIGNSLLH